MTDLFEKKIDFYSVV